MNGTDETPAQIGLTIKSMFVTVISPAGGSFVFFVVYVTKDLKLNLKNCYIERLRIQT